MKNIYLKLLPAIFILSFNVVKAQTIHRDYEDGKIWFKIKDNSKVTLAEINALERVIPVNYPIPSSLLIQHGVTEIVKPFTLLSSPALELTYKIEFISINDIDAFVNELQQLPFIEYAEKVPNNRACLIPNDANYAADQWYLPAIDADKAWNISTGSATAVVAIVDNAVQTDHVDLAANIYVNAGEIAGNNIDDDNNGYIDDVSGYDVADLDNNPSPPNTTFTHGTHVAGCAGAVGNNSIGVASVGFGIKIMPVKVTKNTATNSLILSHCYEGVQYAIAAGADVINMSWGSYAYSATSENIMNAAHNKGIVLVAAAGNDSLGTPCYPAAYAHVIAVANVRKNDLVAKSSNFGTHIDIATPGSQIYSTLPGNTYGNMSGTSMACPVTAGLCGLLLSINPALTPDQITNCIKSTAEAMPNEPMYLNGKLGAGRINANDAALCASTITGITPTIAQATNVNAYVNASGQLLVEFNNAELGAVTIGVYNQLGQQLNQKSLTSTNNHQEQFEISTFANGIYFLVVEGNEFRSHTKFIKH